jgi:hypothetical protein
MRIVLQHKGTGLYFQDIGVWTRDSSNAMDFVSSTSAIQFCEINKIDSAQIVLKFEQENYDIVMPAITPADPAPRMRVRTN